MDRARAAVDTATAGEGLAAEHPNPTLSFGLERTHFADPTSTSPWTWGPNFDIPIETANHRGLRMRQASHGSAQARLALAEAAWQVYAGVRDAWDACAEARAAVAEAVDFLALRRDVLAGLETRFAAGDVDASALQAARRERMAAERALQEARRGVQSTEIQLAAACGLSHAAIATLKLEFTVSDLPEGKRLLRPTVLANRLSLQRLLASYAAAETELEAEVARQYPDVHLNPGLQWDQGDQKYALGIGLELPLFNQHSGAIHLAEARRSEAATACMAAQTEAFAEAAVRSAAYRAALASARLATRQRIQAEQQQADAHRLFAAGACDQQNIQEASLTSLFARRAEREAAHVARQAFFQLENLAQSPLDRR